MARRLELRNQAAEALMTGRLEHSQALRITVVVDGTDSRHRIASRGVATVVANSELIVPVTSGEMMSVFMENAVRAATSGPPRAFARSRIADNERGRTMSSVTLPRTRMGADCGELKQSGTARSDTPARFVV
jgi:hypothetical protein